MTDVRAGVVGTGFVGLLHVEALRRLGVQVVGVVGSTPERARAKAAAHALPPVVESLEALLADPSVDAVHIATPNHLHYPQVRDVLAAGKHVVCEKPLALSAAESGELVQLARASGIVHATNFNIRFYPNCRQARALCAAGELGELWSVHGSYLQDWLLLPTDWNWRLDPAQGGELRAVADIGSHWLDLTSYVTGLRVEAVLAELRTFVPLRRRPRGEVETFAGADTDVERADERVTTEDAAFVLLRLENGACGSLTVSQVSAGRKNALSFEVDGSAGALAWSSERCEELWLGRRERPSELSLRDPARLEPEARRATSLPAGHTEGFADTFKELYRAVYRDVLAGGPSERPDYPTFEAGHEENLLGEAIAASARGERWVTVPRSEEA
ncbi:MAG: Gfo/Idh/MocA family oxidoreductase [Actinobacteria bacterium]|nr:Gfo/Idh/MocA family oxidoreductase [Actinomycetota bacterium]